MKTIADQIYADQYSNIQALLEALAWTDFKQVSHLLQTALEPLAKHQPQGLNAEETQSLFFLNALQKRLHHGADQLENLYLLPDQGQQIQMFDFMAQKFPVVRYGQEIINQAYLKVLQDQTEITLWDIGIGSGQQMARLLTDLFQAGKKPKQVTVIGLDPSAASVAQAEKTLHDTCQAAGVSFRYLGIPKTVEALDELDWRNIHPLLEAARGHWIANASFALHHIRPTPLRSAFFKRIKTYAPGQIGLIEPYADFLTSDLRQRFANAWHHYGLTFWAVDQIDAPVERKSMLKSTFFSREIQDVIGKDDSRVEQFETGEMWVERLQNAGFQVTPPEALAAAIPNFPSVGIQTFEQFAGFTVKGFPIISLILAS